MRHLTILPRRRLVLPVILLLIGALIILIEIQRTVSVVDAKPTSASPTMQTANPMVSGKWTNVIPMRDVPVHISLLPNGKLLYWGRDKQALPPNGDGHDVQGHCNTFLLDSLYADAGTSVTNTIVNPTTNLFCSGHSFLPDGRLLVAGGHKRPLNLGDPGGEGYGDEKLNIFDPRKKEWSTAGSMPHGRWYPFNLTLNSGETIIMSGSYQDGSRRKNTIPDIFDLNGGLRQAAEDTGFHYVFYRSNYPYIFLAPDGRVFHAYAPEGDNKSRFLNLTTNTWTVGPTTVAPHDQGTAVMYAPGKILLAGGAGLIHDGRNNVYEPHNGAEVIDLNATTPSWMSVSPMNYPRLYPTSALLPDGKVLVAGGTRCRGGNNIQYEDPDPEPPDMNCTNGQILSPEIWDPAANTWTVMAPYRETRVYHTTVILLPDGRVMVAGSGLPVARGENGTDGFPCLTVEDFDKYNPQSARCLHNGHRNAEIFSPPYLFDTDGVGNVVDALRPAIVSAPDTIAYNQQFSVEVGNVARSDIKEVVLIRLPSVTHDFNQDQRRVVLQKQDDAQNAQTLKVTAPVDGNACPPGPYMMFVVRNGRGTPSMAKMVTIGKLSLDRTNLAFLPEEYPDDTESLIGTVKVKAAATVSWSARVEDSASSWITLTQANGTGDGIVEFRVAANTTNTRRTPGKVFVTITGEQNTGYEFTVYQGGKFTDVVYPGTSSTPTQFHEDISKIFAMGVTIGCGGSQYCLSDNVTRTQMAIFLTRALGGDLNELPDAPQRFDDVPMPADPNNRATYRAVEFLARKGITQGCQLSPPKFCPNNVVSRAEMATFIIRALGLSPAKPTVAPFNDVPVDHWAAPFVAEMKARDITAGCGGGNYCPTGPVTRHSMARFLRVAFKL